MSENSKGDTIMIKSVGNVLTIVATIFLPAVVIVCVLGVPPIVQIALIAVYAYCLYKIMKNYFLAKVMVWNGYCYWYVKSLLTDDEFKTVVYHLNYQDHIRLQSKISTSEYNFVLSQLSVADQTAIKDMNKQHFQLANRLFIYTHKRA